MKKLHSTQNRLYPAVLKREHCGLYSRVNIGHVLCCPLQLPFQERMEHLLFFLIRCSFCAHVFPRQHGQLDYIHSLIGNAAPCALLFTITLRFGADDIQYMFK